MERNIDKPTQGTHHLEQSIELDVPVRTAYNQWTQFESFPRFMEGVEHVEQLDEKRLHWVAKVAGVRKEWEAEIVGQIPDQLISWHSTTGTPNGGSVTFQDLGENRCKITLGMDYEPETGVEKVGDALGVLKARVAGDLRRFKEFIESRQVETGAWRGEIRGGEVKRGGSGASKETFASGTTGASGAAGTSGAYSSGKKDY